LLKEKIDMWTFKSKNKQISSIEPAVFCLTVLLFSRHVEGETTQESFDSNFISFHQVVVKKKIAKDFQSETLMAILNE
jgi:hypothetical protein